LYHNKPPENDIAIFTQILKDEIKNEIINELRTSQKYDQIFDVYQEEINEPIHEGIQQGRSPYIKNVTGTLSEGKYATHHPGQIVRNRSGGAIQEWINVPTKDQRNGILYGIGTVALLGMLLPNFRQKILNVVGNTASEGAELIEKARFMIARAKEDVEDLIAEASFNSSTRKSR
jgi:hypothetical protein